MKINKLLLGFFVFISATLPVAAHELKYAAPLSSDNVLPTPHASPATGSVLVTIDLDLVTMRVEANFSGLLGSVTAAHIHCCVDWSWVTYAGYNTEVATQLPSFIDFPLGITAGTYDHTFNMADASSYNPAFITNHVGFVPNAFNDLIYGGFLTSAVYFDLHTNLFPEGEVLGFFSRVGAVPEPESYALLLAGLGVLSVFARRIKRETV
jgi:hypothetical protein